MSAGAHESRVVGRSLLLLGTVYIKPGKREVRGVVVTMCILVYGVLYATRALLILREQFYAIKRVLVQVMIRCGNFRYTHRYIGEGYGKPPNIIRAKKGRASNAWANGPMILNFPLL